MQSPQTALGTSRLQDDGKSPFEIAGTQWQSIQDYTAKIAARDSRELPDLIQFASAITALYSDCQKWQTVTSAGILGLAHDTSDYGTSVVPVAYGKLEAALEKVDQNNNPQIKQCCNDTISGLQDHCRRMNDAAKCLLPDIRDLIANATLVAQQIDNAHHQSRTTIDEIISFYYAASFADPDNIASIVGSLEKLEGGWAAITSDLGDLQQWISTQIDANQPFASELAIDAAISEWATVADEAKAFADAANQPFASEPPSMPLPPNGLLY